ncbi:NUDIX hydrolase [Streptomyces spiramenti]|uniref:NUDIX hydrolase n=1 Tax=Streptomyces spiramenti TaxID=2720606 RepID=A0ABX1AX62_9ACTN|nr:NUDIX hydrolase [Streptomyces spiramenti]NJP68817.1 NUDIX hydrolase [Streptomyces spiramenti]
MSLHRDASRVLERWQAPDEGQHRLRHEYRTHLASYPDALRRECAVGHLTASALVVDPEREQVLLTLHAKLDMWLQTGGHCEDTDTSLAGAALREASEESGIEGLRLLEQPVALDRHLTPCAVHLDVQYVAIAPRGAVARRSEESTELRWFGFGEVAGVADGSVVRLAARAHALL